jgi:hypothetical protein
LQALGDPPPLLVLRALDHLVESFRPERLQDALPGKPVGGSGVRHGEHVGARPAGADFLLQPPQHRLAARAQELHLDAGLPLESACQLLGLRHRRRGVPAQRAFAVRGVDIGSVGREGDARRCERDPESKNRNRWNGGSHGLPPWSGHAAGFLASVPIPKFATVRGTLSRELRNRRTLATL